MIDNFQFLKNQLMLLQLSVSSRKSEPAIIEQSPDDRFVKACWITYETTEIIVRLTLWENDVFTIEYVNFSNGESKERSGECNPEIVSRLRDEFLNIVDTGKWSAS